MSKPVRTAGVAVLLLLGAVSCGTSSGTDADTSGRRARAVEDLRRAGLTRAQAECTTDALGSDVVVEAPDMATLAGSRAYQEAVKDCTDGG